MLEEDKKINWFLFIIVACCIAVIAFTFYVFYQKKNYEFVVEVSCDPSKEKCFERDCSTEDNCPPNGLSKFKRLTLKAGDFKFCENENCASACESGVIKCNVVECKPNIDFGESCTSLEENQITQ